MKKIIYTSSVIIFLFCISTLANVARADSVNLIQNPSLETVSAGSPDTPDLWFSDNFGNNSVTFTYPVAGYQGGNAAKVDMTQRISGDAKWFFQPVPVTGGKQYVFSDQYISTVITNVVVQYTLSDGSLDNVSIGNAPASTNWNQFTAAFTAPQNAVKVTVLHRIRKVGSLTVDQYSLTDPSNIPPVDPPPVSPPPPPPPVVPPVVPPPPVVSSNLILNPSAEISTNNFPNNWYTDLEGNNNAIFTYPVPGKNGGSAVQTTITSFTDGDAKWIFEPVPVEANADYSFSEYYKSDTKSVLIAAFTLSNGTRRYTNLATLPPTADWTLTTKEFNAPPGTVLATVLHVIRSVGTLTIDDVSLSKLPSGTFSEGLVSLSFDDDNLSFFTNVFPVLQSHGMAATENVVTDWIGQTDKMTLNQLNQINKAGIDIGAHSTTHPFLTALSDSEAQTEILGSKNTLLSDGLSPVTTFAYPYGEYDDRIESLVQNSGFKAGRGTNLGFNTKNTDIYALRTQNIESDTTLAQVKTWIDQAKQNHTWLILGFHEIANNNPTDIYTIPTSMFQSIVDYLAQTNIKVATTDYVASNLMK